MKGKQEMFNISSLALKDTTALQLRHPVTDEPLWADAEQTKPVAIHLYGSSSKQYRNAVTAMQNRALKRGKKQISAEDMRKEGIELLVSCTDSVENFELEDGTVPKTADDFRDLYGNPAFSWIKDQVDAGIGDVANFLQE